MRYATFLLCGLLAAGCAKEKQPLGAQAYQGDLEKMGQVPAFDFLERAGVAVGNETLRGNVWVASFIFTRCQTHCLILCGEMTKLQEEFKETPDFRIVATTVDPAYDTAGVLKKFAQRYEANEKWLFLTGNREDIKAFAHEGLKIQWHPDEPLIHSVYFVLVDRQGRIRGYYDGTDRARMKKMRQDIRTLLAEAPA